VAIAPDPAPAGLAAESVELTLQLAARIAPLLAERIAGLAEAAPAELSFGNLWLFRHVHRWRFHEGPWPCVSGVAYDGQRHALPLFDTRRAPAQVLRELLACHGCLFPLLQREVDAVARGEFELAANRDDADYVYPAGQFRRYSGPALQKKANLMSQLRAAHSVSSVPYTPALQHAALQVLQGWMHDKGKAAGEADDAACREALVLAPALRLEGFLYHADERPAGFLLAEQLQPGVWVVRFAKGLVRYKGIGQYMFHDFACRTDRVVDWLNFEQDLGLPNFRQTKTSYRPAALLPKWRLFPGGAGSRA
jgi:uncharacterized protein